MRIRVNTDSNIEGREKVAAYVRRAVETGMSRFSGRITQVEVHLSDENGHKSGRAGKRCMIEARLVGRQATTVAHRAATLDQAIDGAIGRSKRSLESALERQRDHRQASRG